MTKIIDQRLSELEARIAKLEDMAGAGRGPEMSPQPSRKKISAKEFLLTKVFKSELEKTLIFAYYLERNEEMLSFNVNDMMGVFRAAKEKRPINTNDAVAKNVARGFLMEATERKDGKKAWTLTATGERYVENDLNK